MWQIPTICESAETPELGGAFGDLILICRPYLAMEQKIQSKKYWDVEWDKKSHVKQPVYNGLAFINALDDILLSLIIGWKNCETEYSEENKQLLLRLSDDLTNMDIEENEKDADGELTGNKVSRKARLGEFIMSFASNSENFKKKTLKYLEDWVFWYSEWESWKGAEAWEELPDFDKEVINFYFNYYNTFSKESGLLRDEMQSVMADMSSSERLIFTQKLQMILATMGRLQEEDIRNQRKNEELKEAREGKRKLFEE